MADEWVVELAQAASAGAEVCGGKGFNLGRLLAFGFSVPPGAVLVAEAYRRHMAAAVFADASPHPETECSLRDLRQAIRDAPLPQEVEVQLATFLSGTNLAGVPLAVRSSATAEDGADHSFAGIHASFLGVVGLEAVRRAIKRCYASLWTSEAVAYRRRSGLSDAQVACAVVLCRLIQCPDGRPLPAGVAFSCDPRTGRRDRVVIDAALGAGATVGGDVAPEEIHVAVKHGGPRLTMRSSPAGVILSDDLALQLARLVLRVEEALGDGQDPQDVEWAHDGRQWWLLQARPVTRLLRPTFSALADQPVIWSNANLVDSLPGVVSTLGWSLVRVVLWPLLFATVEAVGCPLPPGLEPVRRFSGRAYFDLSCLQQAYFEALGILPAETNRALGGHQPEIALANDRPARGRSVRLMAKLKVLWLVLTLPRTFPRDLAAIHNFAGRLSATDPALLPNADLLASMNETAERMVAFSARCELTDTGSFWQSLLEELLTWLLPDRGRAVASGLMAGTGTVTSAEHGYRLAELAAVARDDPAARAYLEGGHRDLRGWCGLPPDSPFRAAFENFLESFGHRGVYEADIANPRWSEDETYLLQQMRLQLDSAPFAGLRDRGRSLRSAAEAELRSRCFWLRPLVHWLAARAQEMASLREAGKSALVAPLRPLRRIALQVGLRLVQAGALDDEADVFHLTREDLECFLRGEWNGSGARALVAARKARDAHWRTQSPPGVIVVEPAGRAGSRSAGTAAHIIQKGTCFQGLGIASGRATGRARVLQHPREGDRLRAGEVLIAPSTDPGWTPLFLRAAAVVAEVGGYLSHGAIVAREYGLPAVSNVPGLLQTVRDGCRVSVDGDTGEVLIEND